MMMASLTTRRHLALALLAIVPACLALACSAPTAPEEGDSAGSAMGESQGFGPLRVGTADDDLSWANQTVSGFTGHQVKTSGGIGVSIEPSTSSTLTQGSSFNGMFKAGEKVLFGGTNPDPIVLRFARPVRGVETSVQVAAGRDTKDGTPYLGYVQALDADGNVIGEQSSEGLLKNEGGKLARVSIEGSSAVIHAVRIGTEYKQPDGTYKVGAKYPESRAAHDPVAIGAVAIATGR